MDANAAIEEAIDELAFAGPEHLDPAFVARYDKKARVEPDDDLALLRDHGFAAESLLVDIGAGTGTFAVAAAARCRKVIAVDVSPAMVAAIERKASEAGMTNVECVVGGFLSYEHTGPPADVIYTRNALHHLPDFWKAIALQRMAKIVRAGGVLYLRDLVFAFDLRDANTFIRAWLATARTNPQEGWTREELEAHLRDEHSTFNWLLEPMIEQAGFDIESSWHGGVSVYAHYICRRRER